MYQPMSADQGAQVRNNPISLFLHHLTETHIFQTAYTAIDLWAKWQILTFQKQYTVLLLILCFWASNNTLLNCSLEDQYRHMVLNGIATVYSTIVQNLWKTTNAHTFKSTISPVVIQYIVHILFIFCTKS